MRKPRRNAKGADSERAGEWGRPGELLVLLGLIYAKRADRMTVLRGASETATVPRVRTERREAFSSTQSGGRLGSCGTEQRTEIACEAVKLVDQPPTSLPRASDRCGGRVDPTERGPCVDGRAASSQPPAGITATITPTVAD
jgi:hypothetical protein